MSKKAYRASILHFLADPDTVAPQQAFEYFDDGVLVVDEVSGCVVQVGCARELLASQRENIPVQTYPGQLIMPGLIDVHTHYPQMEVMTAPGGDLLQWLNTYVFPAERKFSDPVYAYDIAVRFVKELLRAGTTTALVFCTVHKASVDAFFKACEKYNVRMVAGKVMMDTNAPDYLLDTAQSAFDDSQALIDTWHNRGRARYAVTPRFAPTSTPAQLQKAAELLQNNPGVYLHTHLSENKNEIAWVKKLFPACDDYLSVYEQAGLLGRRSVFAHCVHLTHSQWQRLANSHCGCAFCPGSNLFLGSGLFSLSDAVNHRVRVGLGTDIGAGSSFSLLQTLSDANKVLPSRQQTLHPLKGFYLATLGGASVLDMDDVIGNFVPGKEADFIVINKTATELLEFHMQFCTNLSEKLGALSVLGDDRLITATYVAAKKVYEQ